MHERVRGRLYGYNKANRLKTVTVAATVRGTYTYNGFEQLISRVITNSGTANGPLCVGASDAHPHPRRYFVHDLWDNVIAELTTAGATVREYIYLPESEIAPTRQARAQVDRPIAVVDAVNTATPATLMVHVDHLNRPVRMTNSAKASVWEVTFTPWGSFHSATGAQTLNTRFPGQWFQLESALHYNWHRHYDPSLGRYTQPDPLGFVDGPSVYAYAKNHPGEYVDPDGRFVPLFCLRFPRVCKEIYSCIRNPERCKKYCRGTASAIYHRFCDRVPGCTGNESPNTAQMKLGAASMCYHLRVIVKE
ncbi:MAG: RHS repeat-associated core domain-containing protein, partial [Hyphomicrobium sp.]